MVCTEDTIKAVKAKRAELNKRFSEFETLRKDIKSKILAPYEEFDTELFIRELKKQDCLVTGFDEKLWFTLMDYITVYSADDIRFTFKNGTEIKA